MNIFFVSNDPVVAAQSMVDRHVIKMVLESAQLLSTAHRVLDGQQYIDASSGRKIKRWRLLDERESVLYSATHIHHPSAVWTRQSNNNYNWLYCHFIALMDEYTYRYGKIHKCHNMLSYLKTPPSNIPINFFTPPPPAMPDQYKVSDSVQSYRNYYIDGKKHLHKYTKRAPPTWLS